MSIKGIYGVLSDSFIVPHCRDSCVFVFFCLEFTLGKFARVSFALRSVEQLICHLLVDRIRF